jgi:predicted RNase H-like nuclease (RuvC/YqgF family)
MESIEDHFRRREAELRKLNEQLRPPVVLSETAVCQENSCITSLLKVRSNEDDARIIAGKREAETRLAERESELERARTDLSEAMKKIREMDSIVKRFEGEIRSRDFKLNKSRDEILDLKKRISELSIVDKSVDEELRMIRHENERFKKLISSKIYPLLMRKNELIHVLRRMVKVAEVDGEVLNAVDDIASTHEDSVTHSP